MVRVSRVRAFGDSLEVRLDDGTKIRALPTGSGWFCEPNGFGITLVMPMANFLMLQISEGDNVLAYPSSNSDLWYCGPSVPGDPGEYPDPDPDPVGGYWWPFNPAAASSEYGPRPSPGPGVPSGFHSGIDLAAASGAVVGAPIPAAAAGTVIHVRNKNNGAQPGNTSWGNRVGIQHTTDTGRALFTYYCHMQDGGFAQVSEGQVIAAGTILGYIGKTGLVTGNHLHFVTYYDGLGNAASGNLVNPRDWMAEFNPSGQVWA